MWRSLKIHVRDLTRCKLKTFIILPLIFALAILIIWLHGEGVDTAMPYERQSKRLVHLDLKGAPPKISYYEQLFPLLREFGATGLLVEWEDVFPYWGDLQLLAAPHAYSNVEVAKMLQLAEDNKLEVIPLVQTFGHFEFVLKHDKFRPLREVESYPNALCPSRTESLNVVKAMISQLLQLHPNSKFVHIGADEVWHLGKCSKCQERMQSESKTKEHLFLDHVKSVANYTLGKHPSVKVIMWDDMFRSMDIDLIRESRLESLVEPMIWHYLPEFRISLDLLDKYSSIFPSIWAASSFKGATGPRQVITSINHHLYNHRSWIKFLIGGKRLSKFKTFRGYAITGWQRYDHYATLCELLPEAIPSLFVCLQTLKNGEFTDQMHSSISRKLGFSEPVELEVYPRPKPVPKALSFPGQEIYRGCMMLANYKVNLQRLLEHDIYQGWFGEWQMGHNFTNPLWVEELLSGHINSLRGNFISLRDQMQVALVQVYDESTVEEWLETHLLPDFRKVEKMAETALMQRQIGARVKDYRFGKNK
ncbi:PREDICTED: hexosaminidase D-like isoform X2 [Priapulus caudatus]|uniref:beta-N-acetylhexosaminidase n=1 Tax=Priapulus caudatus TaxID=37621 RepID=A0ABM1EJW4_PRICU|nr:PREDICTED: hexosaminidase D-like isoform X2 [Priapulus caudatus]